MSEAQPAPSVLIVADPQRIGELATVLTEPFPQGSVAVLVSSGGDDTIDLCTAKRPHVVVVTASLEAGDSKALVEALRDLIPRAQMWIVLVGDAVGPIKTALDAEDIEPDKFVQTPIVPALLRAAVGTGLDHAMRARAKAPSRPPPPPQPGSTSTSPPTDAPSEAPTEANPESSGDGTRRARRKRWEKLADSLVEIQVDELWDDSVVELRQEDVVAELVSEDIVSEDIVADMPASDEEAPALPPPIQILPRRAEALPGGVAPPHAWQPGNTAELANVSDSWPPSSPTREPTLIISDPAPPLPPAPDAELVGGETDRTPPGADVDLEGLEDDLALGHGTASREARLDVVAGERPPEDGRDFARQLRAKMSMMAQRLFQGADAAAPAPAVDLSPKHDHHTEIDLSTLGDEPVERGSTEIEVRSAVRPEDIRALATSPGTWDSQIRERGLPDAGEIVRGLSDAAMLLAKMFAQASTGRILFRQADVEKVVYFDQGRPVFASSSQVRDRMGELLVREGKITASQYERCQTAGAESGRRMGEILVDFGYLKRRELLPAVRRHVEDIIYSVFGWDRGGYQITLETVPSAERIRLSRHPASLILEGIRRKLDRTSLDRLIGSASTVIDVPDRERLGGIINLGDLAVEERGALAAFDGQADLATVARAAGVDVADVLPLAWGLCVLGLATARRTDTEVPDESSALVGETDLAIDRERVRARWALVDEADYFALLGVRRDATAFEIRRAYQSARRDFAADCFPTDLRRELAQELDDIAHVLDEAFRVLRDDRLRLTYLANLID